MKAAVFIERDGVLNAVRVERQQPVSPLTLEDFHVNQAAVPLLKKLKAAGLLLIATTNQPGLSRGYQARRELDRMHELLRVTFALDDILVCPHDATDHCTCRLPNPGLLVEAGFKVAPETGALLRHQRQVAGRRGGPGGRGHLPSAAIAQQRQGA
jgi:D-glycero-D-manno-heptose 1,7-bisphosphate phosphatase